MICRRRTGPRALPEASSQAPVVRGAAITDAQTQQIANLMQAAVDALSLRSIR